LATTEVPEAARFDYLRADAETIATARRLAATCARHGVSLPAAALQFPLRQPAVAAVVCGMRDPAEVRDDAATFAQPIPPALWDGLDAPSAPERSAFV
jgi:D-threo-aldose 1-dehydrogenase